MLAQITYDQLLVQLKRDLAGVNTSTTNTITQINTLFPASWGSWPMLAIAIISGLFLLILFFGSFFTVEQQSVAVVERFGKFVRLAKAGLNFKLPLIESVVGEVDMRVQELATDEGKSPRVTTKTKDDVTVTVNVCPQYCVIPGREFDAHYSLEDPEEQMFTYLNDSVRAKVPKMTLDDLFSEKDAVASVVEEQLRAVMLQYGYQIKAAPVTGIWPDEKVTAAMNEINAAQRLQVAAQSKGEAEKIIQVKNAEAQAEADKLRGKGIADQRIEIARGMKQSVEEIRHSAPGTQDHEILTMLMMSQYLETLEKVSTSSQTNTIMIPHSPGGMTELRDQIAQSFLLAKETKK